MANINLYTKRDLFDSKTGYIVEVHFTLPTLKFWKKEKNDFSKNYKLTEFSFPTEYIFEETEYMCYLSIKMLGFGLTILYQWRFPWQSKKPKP